MPRIQLKPRSPQFAERAAKPRLRACDMPGCAENGEHRAPKDRSLQDHYWFCYDHVREYNAAWDYFSGMPAEEVENHIVNSLYGDRPTWRYDMDAAAAALRRAAWQAYHFTEEEPPKEEFRKPAQNPNTPEFEALSLMGLEPPVTLDGVKIRYKELAKKYHPDLNPGDKKAEDLLKSINMAYTILKLSYAKFEKLEK
jgi:hypothetical protein